MLIFLTFFCQSSPFSDLQKKKLHAEKIFRILLEIQEVLLSC